jgi:hypothetical protein
VIELDMQKVEVNQNVLGGSSARLAITSIGGVPRQRPESPAPKVCWANVIFSKFEKITFAPEQTLARAIRVVGEVRSRCW